MNEKKIMLKIFDLQNILLFISILGFCYILKYVYHMIHFAYFGPLSKIPGPKLHFLLKGLTSWKQKNGMRWKWIQYEIFPKYGPIVRIAPNAILFADKDIIKQILVTNEFPKNRKYESMRLSSVTLLTATDIQWHKQRRKLLSSAFSIKYLDSLEPLIQSVIKSLIKKINVTLDVDSNDSNGTVINLSKMIHECTMDIVGETAFGCSFKMIENGDLPLIRKIFEERRRRSLISLFPILKPFKPADPYIENFARDLLKNRRQNIRREDLLQIMLDTQQDEGGMSDNEIYNQIIEFIFAGSDTSSFTITMLFAMLMENPTIEKKLVNELDEALKDEELSHIKLKPLTYLNCVINEVLRLHPISHDVGPGKVTTKDMVLGGYFIPKKTILCANIFQLHHSAKYWGDDVNEFIPERWLNPDKIPKDCFIPFSAGTRNCIGNNFALMVIRLLTSTLLKMYRFEYISGQDMDVVQFLTPNFKTKRYDIRIWKR
ncbi:hypothetical protein Glove_30g32 [Diversispora epigaea]|uniref:Cytochrome P450 n=1 Tax=Diversispora epigaea TaxID=1348612 RepID=A0A397JS75_9GLOM|nr:hypothetical protein Glove_30g32 [Diversispora epigaea]